MNLAGIVIIIAILVTIVVFARNGCGRREGFRIPCMGSDWGEAMHRTPVDYVFKENGGARLNPHWQADPTTKFQPLEQGPVDFYPSERRLAENKLFKNGCGALTFNLWNDGKDRSDVLYRGGYGINRYMHNAPNPAFGPGVMNTEQQYNIPSPFAQLYGGPAFLTHDRFGD